MKKMRFVCLSACMLLICCKKPYIDFPWQNGHAHEKEYMLKTMRFHYTNSPTEFTEIAYNFYFNNKRQIDSIIYDPEVLGAHFVFRSKHTIDSIVNTAFGTMQHGLRWYVRSGFQYNSAGRISRFMIENFRNPGKQDLQITYTNGHVASIVHRDLVIPSPPTSDLFVYDQNDIATWTTIMPDAPHHTRRYTYDKQHYNPLYPYANDLMAIFAGLRNEWEFFLASEHVKTSKFYTVIQQTVTYRNFYDRKGRLIKQVFTEPGFTRPDSLTFEYMK